MPLPFPVDVLAEAVGFVIGAPAFPASTYAVIFVHVDVFAGQLVTTGALGSHLSPLNSGAINSAKPKAGRNNAFGEEHRCVYEIGYAFAVLRAALNFVSNPFGFGERGADRRNPVNRFNFWPYVYRFFDGGNGELSSDCFCNH
jgi:hypothetical protein